MNVRKGVAEDLKKVLLCEAHTEQEEIKKRNVSEIFNTIDNYYKIYDLDNNTNHSQIFESLYFSKKYLSNMVIAQKTYISVDALKTYIVKYNRLIALMIESLNLKL